MSVKFYDIKCDKCGSTEWDAKDANYYCRNCGIKMSDEKIKSELQAAFENHKKELKVFKCDDISWIVALDRESARKHFVELYEVNETEKDNVAIEEEIDLEKGYWSELDLGDIVNELNYAKVKEFKIRKDLNGYWLWETFDEVLKSLSKDNILETFETFEICSTEF